jgi:RHS repeat-associated protein
LAEVTFPDGVSEAFERDSRGNVTGFSDRAGEQIWIRYNYRNQVLEKQFPDGTTEQFRYDGDGRLIWAKDRSGITRTFVYDQIGRRVLEDCSESYPVEYVYDSSSNLVGLWYPDGSRLQYTYDERGLMRTLTDEPSGDVYAFEYDSQGRRTRLTYPNGMWVQYEYDLVGHLITLSQHTNDGLVERRSYAYDALGNIVLIADSSGTSRYEYDAASRLVSVTRPGAKTTRYAYDAMGNRSSVLRGEVSLDYECNALDQYTHVGDIECTYDVNANLVAKIGPDGARSYLYDESNRLVLASSLSGATVTTVTIAYDAFGRRASRAEGGEETVQYIWAGYEELLELDAQGHSAARYVYAPRFDELLSVETGGQKYYCLVDQVGTILSLAGSSGESLKSFSLDEFGQPAQAAAADSELPTALGERYTGRPYDSDLALYDFRARYYDPELGRFMSPDPLWEMLEGNAYTYVYNNPLIGIDPFGAVPIPTNANSVAMALMDAVPMSPTVFKEVSEDVAGYAHAWPPEAHARSFGLSDLPESAMPSLTGSVPPLVEAVADEPGREIADVVSHSEGGGNSGDTRGGSSAPPETSSGGKSYDLLPGSGSGK